MLIVSARLQRRREPRLVAGLCALRLEPSQVQRVAVSQVVHTITRTGRACSPPASARPCCYYHRITWFSAARGSSRHGLNYPQGVPHPCRSAPAWHRKRRRCSRLRSGSVSAPPRQGRRSQGRGRRRLLCLNLARFQQQFLRM